MMIGETVNRWVCCMTEQKTKYSCGEAKRPERILACLKPEYCTKWQGKSREKQNKQARAGLLGSAGRKMTDKGFLQCWGQGQSRAPTLCKRWEFGATTAGLFAFSECITFALLGIPPPPFFFSSKKKKILLHPHTFYELMKYLHNLFSSVFLLFSISAWPLCLWG